MQFIKQKENDKGENGYNKYKHRHKNITRRNTQNIKGAKE